MSQTQFAAALLDPAHPMPAGLVGPDGLPDAKRFSVYRNTVNSSLIRVLEAAFPAVQKLVGPAFFSAMALVYLRQAPPTDRRLMLYGESFAEFLAGFAPVAHLGYLADVARLEQALRQSYHAADASPLPSEALGSMGEDQLLQARIRLAPSLRVLASNWPVHAIWHATLHDGPKPQMRADELVVLRPEFDPTVHLLPPGGAAFLATLGRGEPLIAALAATGEGFDLTRLLGLLLHNNAIVGVTA